MSLAVKQADELNEIIWNLNPILTSQNIMEKTAELTAVKTKCEKKNSFKRTEANPVQQLHVPESGCGVERIRIHVA